MFRRLLILISLLAFSLQSFATMNSLSMHLKHHGSTSFESFLSSADLSANTHHSANHLSSDKEGCDHSKNTSHSGCTTCASCCIGFLDLTTVPGIITSSSDVSVIDTFYNVYLPVVFLEDPIRPPRFIAI